MILLDAKRPIIFNEEVCFRFLGFVQFSQVNIRPAKVGLIRYIEIALALANLLRNMNEFVEINR